jgi:fatty-acyl-CoA synthase
MPNSVKWIPIALGIINVGAVLVPVNTWYKEDELSHVMKNSDISLLFSVDRFLKNDYREIFHKLRIRPKGGKLINRDFPFLRNIVIYSTGSQDTPDGFIQGIDFETPREDADRRTLGEIGRETQAFDPCIMLYTSGSTGRPKGVIHTHESIIRNAINISERMFISHEDRIYSHFPFFFSAGFCNAFMGGFVRGATIFTHEKFDPEEAIEIISRYKCTVHQAWPNAVKELIASPWFDPTKVATLEKGTFPLGLQFPELKLKKDFGVNMYGMTETATAFTSNCGDDSDETRLSAHGTPFNGTELRVVDPDTGETKRTDEPGEIYVKGYNVFQGYHKLPKADYFTTDGYFRTGDMGLITSEGQLRYLGRISQTIKVSGFNVSPDEIEEMLLKHDGVLKAFVVGKKDHEKEEVPTAFIVRKGESEVSAEELMAFLRKKISSYKVPSHFHFVKDDELSYTGTGKVNRKSLRALAENMN